MCGGRGIGATEVSSNENKVIGSTIVNTVISGQKMMQLQATVVWVGMMLMMKLKLSTETSVATTLSFNGGTCRTDGAGKVALN